MNECMSSGLFKIDSSYVNKRLDKSMFFGCKDLDRKLFGFSKLILSEQENSKLAKIDFNPCILLYGPPNTGKTTSIYSLFKRIKTEINNDASLFILSISSLMSSDYGATSKNLVSAFEELKRDSSFDKPSLLIIDEMDQICMSRSKENEHDASRRAMSALMLELDQLHPSIAKGLIVVGITNVPEKIDNAILRRFTLKEKVNPKLDYDEFSNYLTSLFCTNEINESDLKLIFELYNKRELTVPDIKGFFKNAMIEAYVNNDFDIISFITNEFEHGYSSIENKLI
ncbi:ATP-binding protein [Aliivibrio wodanis]|uniref:ATP-binding protein n=1 Tax=Aliivibrio wodanis TaxID=80852 RepID=UPI00406D34B6